MDIAQNVTPALGSLGLGEIAASDAMMAELGAEVGDDVLVDGGRLRIAQQIEDPPTNPIPSFWCRYPDLLRPSETSDFRPLWAVASFDTVAKYGGTLFDEYRVVEQPLTLTDAGELQYGYDTATEQWTRSFPMPRSVWNATSSIAWSGAPWRYGPLSIATWHR